MGILQLIFLSVKLISFIILFTWVKNRIEKSINSLWEDIDMDIYEPPEIEDVADETDFQTTDSIIQVVSNSTDKFEDVAGNIQAKKELLEVVKFLKNPQTFSKVGASLPRGVLLSGPPGTGKTLLARALAGEAGTAFIKVSASQFVELLIGVGASRVRQLFEKARSLKPSIVYIDEIDSIAKSRASASVMGVANDEREQTLNQLLTEMDGFQADTGIVVVASTNRLDVLDPAIRRPGRFDRQISLNNPSLKEREAILKVHARGKSLDPSVSFFQVAQRTVGFSGADLANLLNESAILATRLKLQKITTKEINISIDKLVAGLKKPQYTRMKSKQLTAFHESAHAFLACLLNDTQNIQKVSIVPRGSIGGAMVPFPSSRQYQSRKLLINQIFIAIAGRAAEENISGLTDYTVSAQQDLTQITRLIRTMIFRYAMYRLKEFKQENQERNLYLLGSDAKQEVNNIIDNFTTNFIDLTYYEILSFLKSIRPGKERLVDELLDIEELSGAELKFLAKEYLSRFRLYFSETIYKNLESSLFLALIKLLPRKEKK